MLNYESTEIVETIKKNIRVRFAPSPTGMMHLGNVRAALMNYLFAHRHHGTFILRIEDTDQKRNFDLDGKQIIADLNWLGLAYDEGPGKEGGFGPYFQSQRSAIYTEKLRYLQHGNHIYRCFCTQEELEKKHARQVALRQAPRYDRTCAQLPATTIEKNLAENIPFIWRVRLNQERTVTIYDLARKSVTFDLKHFSDFPITRADGSFTFIFANFVDDATMEISHVFRGEDHLSNTASQAVLYELFNRPLPIFWHMPMLCNLDGKKLSKRDFGFSLRDLIDAGFLPEAICNYLGIIGGSFTQEIMALPELAHAVSLDTPPSAGQIKYDVEKLRWVNHQWIERIPAHTLTTLCRPYLHNAYKQAEQCTDEQIHDLIESIKSDLVVLADVVPALKFYFEKPTITQADVQSCVPAEHRTAIFDAINTYKHLIVDSSGFVSTTKEYAHTHKIPKNILFWFLRLALTGSTQGPAINILINMLGTQQATERINHALNLL